MKNIAVVGLGLMGNAIASRLMKAGYRVTGFDVVKKQMSQLIPLGLIPAKSPKDAAKSAELAILSLPSWKTVADVVEGEGGLLETLRKGQIVMDASTSPPWESMALGKRLAKKGIDWMDVPISGSSAQARVGNMVFMAGGKKAVFAKIKPVLDSIGKKTIYVGKSGDGATLKLVINHTLYLNQAAAIEGLVLSKKAGLDPGVVMDAMTSGAASSDLLVSRGKDMLRGDFSPKGPIQMAAKDLALSLETGKHLGVVLPLGALYMQFFAKAQHNGWDRQDATVVMKIYEELARFKVEKPSGKRQR